VKISSSGQTCNPSSEPMALCRTMQWDYEQERPNKGDVLRSKRPAYLHLFCNPEKAARDQAEMNYLTKLYNDLMDNARKESA